MRYHYEKLESTTRTTVERILGFIKERLDEMDNPVSDDILAYHGVKGQRWGVKNGSPYPI